MRRRIGEISAFVLTGIIMLIAAGWGTLVPRSAGYSTRPECFVRMDRAS